MRNKALFCLLMVIVLVFSCSCNKKGDTSNLEKQEISNTPMTTNIPMETNKHAATNTPTVTNITEELDVINNFDISKEENVIEKDAVDNAETAQAIGDAVIKSIEGENYSNLKKIGVTYVKKPRYWLVFRTIGSNDPNAIVLGYCVTCVIKASNGEIIKVYRGE